jgi:hypothetical protein
LGSGLAIILRILPISFDIHKLKQVSYLYLGLHLLVLRIYEWFNISGGAGRGTFF